MKLAVLLFGHIRTYKDCADSLKKNVINQYQADVFMHTWDETDSATLNWESRKISAIKLDDNIKTELNNLYSPKKIMFSHQTIKNDKTITSFDGVKKFSLQGMKYMFQSIDFANKLRREYEKENQIKYDAILCTRPDVLIHHPLEIPEVFKEANQLGLPSDKCRFFAYLAGNSTSNVRLNINRVNDALFFAYPDVIDRYIHANSNLKKENIDYKFNNVVSVYTQNEILSGIIPVDICFIYGYDWEIYRSNQQN